jgi:hypothetical protein
VAKDSDQSAGSFGTENTGGGLAGFLAEENAYDRRALWRIGAWGAAAVVAVVVASMANQSSIGWRRDQLAAADLTRQAQQLQTVARESQNETRRLAAAIDTLNNDRDRLYSRVTVLETGLDSVTGAIARQSAAGPAAAITPMPPATAPKTSVAPPTTAAPAAPAVLDSEPAPATQAAAPAIAPVATAAPAATPPAATVPAPEKPRMDLAKLEPKPEPKPEARLEPKIKLELKPEAKPESKPEPKSEVRSKSDPRIEPKIEAKTEAKSEAKTEPRTEVKKAEAKSDKVEPKIEPKTEQAPAPTSHAAQAAPLAGPLAPANASARPFAAITLVPPSATMATPSASMLGPPDPAAGKLIEPSKLVNAGASPAPVADAMASVTPKENDSSESASAKLPVQRTEFAIELGGANSVNGLRALWRTVRSNADLAELRPIMVIREGNTGLGMQLRLAAGPLHDAASAARICATLVEGGRSCETTVFDGQRLAMSADEVQPTGGKPVMSAVKSGSYRRNAPRHAFTNEPPPPQQQPPQKPEASSSLSSMFGGSKH